MILIDAVSPLLLRRLRPGEVRKHGDVPHAGSTPRTPFGVAAPSSGDAGDMLKHSASWESDAELVRATLAGNGAATERFVGRLICVRRILAAQNARMGGALDPAELDDLAQDTLLLIWRKLDQFVGHSSLETWAYGIASFEMMNAVRRKRREPVLSEVAEEFAEPGPAPALSPALEYEHLERELARLDPLQARVIRLKHFEGRTFDEIARIMSLSINTTKTLHYRGIKRLQVLLSSLEGERRS
jgi:RNA polymerase sigma-70 factor (ECF subfamily)